MWATTGSDVPGVPHIDTLFRMRTGPDSPATPSRRRARLLLSGTSLLAAFTFLAASMSLLVAGAQSASAEDAGQASRTTGTHLLVGHQPTHTRVTPGDGAQPPQHRTAPWTPVSVAPEVARLTAPSRLDEQRASAVADWHPYDSTPAQGRAPPR